MAEILAALFLVAGGVVLLVAAIGVIRLPDAFLRMHAATKAGVMGSGLVLVGVGFAFGGADAWVRVVVVLAFLLATTPVAAHALGRAAYVGGAPLWSGTFADQLRGVLARRVFDIDLARVRQPSPAQQRGEGPRRPAGAFPEEDRAMGIVPIDREASQQQTRVHPHAPAGRRQPAPRRVLVALGSGGSGQEAEASALAEAAAAARAACRQGTEVTLLSLVCQRTLLDVGPVPLGGGHWAQRLAETRLAAARGRAGRLAAAAEAACREAGGTWRLRHEEGDAAELLRAAAAYHDLVIAPRGGWFDHGHALSPAGAAARLAGSGVRPLEEPVPAPVSRVLFLHEGGEAAAAALRRFLALGIEPQAALQIAALDRPEAVEALDEAVVLASAHGRQATTLQAPLHPDAPADWSALGGVPGLVVLDGAQREGRLARVLERAARRSLRCGPAPVLLV